jgi:hypothetical protein
MSDAETMTKALMLLGGLHFTQPLAMLFAPRMLDWEHDLGKLTPMNRRLVHVVLIAITLVVVGLGLVVALSASHLALGGRSPVLLSGFLAVFWCYRGLVQLTVYRRLWPTSFSGRFSHVSLAALFCFLTLGYGAAAVVFARGLGN